MPGAWQGSHWGDRVRSCKQSVDPLSKCSPMPLNRGISRHSKACKLFSHTIGASVQDGIVALGKAHTHSALSLSSLPKVALKTMPIFAWLNTDCSQPWRVECWPKCQHYRRRVLPWYTAGFASLLLGLLLKLENALCLQLVQGLG